jgi:acetoin utilization deacetylase AcuC-like enzyme
MTAAQGQTHRSPDSIAPSVRVVYTPRHWLHHPSHEALAGFQRPIYETPDRIEQIRGVLEHDGGFDFSQLTEHGSEPIEAVHDPGLIRFLETAWPSWQAVAEGLEILPDTILNPALRDGMGAARPPNGLLAQLGYWAFDTATPIVAGTSTAARAAVDVALTTADLVLAGEPWAYGLCRPPGHHAPRAAFGGYCYFNNGAITAEHLARRTHEPVAILDLDFHHGNGTQQIFYSRADVLYVSLHGDPHYAYPYFAGFADETGTGDGLGATLNLPLAAGTTDAEYLQALERGLERVAAFGGSTLVVSLGFDTYVHDPICDFALTTPVYHEIGRRVAALGRKVVVLQEGGYFVPHLGENARQWLRGLDGRPLDYPDSGSNATSAGPS